MSEITTFKNFLIITTVDNRRMMVSNTDLGKFTDILANQKFITIKDETIAVHQIRSVKSYNPDPMIEFIHGHSHDIQPSLLDIYVDFVSRKPSYERDPMIIARKAKSLRIPTQLHDEV